MVRRARAAVVMAGAGLVIVGCQQPREESAAPAAAAKAYSVYVTNEQSGDLTVIDGATHAVTATIPLGKRPRGACFRELSQVTCVHPSVGELQELFDRLPGIGARIADAVADLAGADIELTVKKG